MASSTFAANVLETPVDPVYADEEKAYDRAFAKLDDKDGRDYVRSFKRSNTYGIDWSDDKIFAATKDNALRLYDVVKGVEEKTWAGEWMAIQADPNNSFLCAAISWSGSFKIIDRRDSQPAFDLELKQTSPHMKDFLSLAWSPNSKYIALGNRQDQVYLLNIGASKLALGGSKTMNVEANQLVFSPDSESLWVASGGSPGKITILPMPRLQTAGSHELVAHQYTTLSLAADPRGRHIASAGSDCLVGLWDPNHLVCTRTYTYATQPATALSFNHTGSLLAWGTGGSGSSGGGEKSLTLVGTDTNFYWQEPTAAPVQQVRWHPKRNCLAYALAASGLPDERDSRDRDRSRYSQRENAVVHILNLPEIATVN